MKKWDRFTCWLHPKYKEDAAVLESWELWFELKGVNTERRTQGELVALYAYQEWGKP